MNETSEICIAYQTPSEKAMINIFADHAHSFVITFQHVAFLNREDVVV
jgi:hypothetical protein